jgi:hypothetical protein
MPFGTALPAGTRQLVTIRFDVAPNASGGLTPLTFSDTPVFREAADANANPVQSKFADGGINILSPTAAEVSVSGKVLSASGRGISRAVVSLVFPDGTTRTATTNPFGNYRFTGVPSGETYTLSVRHKQFEFAPSSLVLTLVEDTEGINFTATAEQ